MTSGTRRGVSPRALASACHPAPTVVVTVAVTVLAAGGGRDVAGCLLVAVTVLVGQLSIGWGNDALDVARDRSVGRPDKPAARGEIAPTVLMRCAVAAFVVTVPMSVLAAGWRGGGCHVVLVASGWAYNLGLKATRWSLVPYAIGFGAVPGFVTYGLDPSRPPQWWATSVAALLGVAAGLANAASDVDDDAATGVHGAVGRLGAELARRWGAVTVGAATLVVVAAAPLSAAVIVALLVVVASLLALGLVVRGGPLLFPAVLVIALVDVAVIAATMP